MNDDVPFINTIIIVSGQSHSTLFLLGKFQSAIFILLDDTDSRSLLALSTSLKRSMASTFSSSITDLCFLYLANSASPRRPVLCLLFS